MTRTTIRDETAIRLVECNALLNARDKRIAELERELARLDAALDYMVWLREHPDDVLRRPAGWIPDGWWVADVLYGTNSLKEAVLLHVAKKEGE